MLYDDQFENPRLMRPFKNSVYYEKIKCKPTKSDDSVDVDATVKGHESEDPKGDIQNKKSEYKCPQI